jgi:uncharacterized protein (DUF362 family)
MNRRSFWDASIAGAGALWALPGAAQERAAGAAGKTKVVVARTEDRRKGVTEVMRLLEVPSPKGRKVLIKPNFNTADPAPGWTHNDTLRQLIAERRQRRAGAITIGERSGPRSWAWA